VEAPVEVGQPLAQRALDRAAHQEPVEGASPPGARLIFDRDPIDERVVDLLEVAPAARAGRAALLARRPANTPADSQPPARGIGERDVPVRDEVVKRGRRQVRPHGLEQHPAVAEREPELLGHERTVRWLEGVRGFVDRD